MHANQHIHIHAIVCMRTYIYIYIEIYTKQHEHLNARMRCIYVYVYIYIYTLNKNVLICLSLHMYAHHQSWAQASKKTAPNVPSSLSILAVSRQVCNNKPAETLANARATASADSCFLAVDVLLHAREPRHPPVRRVQSSESQWPFQSGEAVMGGPRSPGGLAAAAKLSARGGLQKCTPRDTGPIRLIAFAVGAYSKQAPTIAFVWTFVDHLCQGKPAHLHK